MTRPFARLTLLDNEVYEMIKPRIIIGRGTAIAPVDVDVGSSSFVSRRHLELMWEGNALKLKCNGKNGIFVDKSFRPYGNNPLILPNRLVNANNNSSYNFYIYCAICLYPRGKVAPFATAEYALLIQEFVKV